MFLTIGHRGAMGYAPENTLASFEKALELGVDMIELDVTLCKSGEIVVFHDDRLERTTNGEGYIHDKTWHELSTLDAGQGQQIPSLKQVLDLINRQVPVNIELKNQQVAKPVVKLLKGYMNDKGWDPEDFIISSFDHLALREFKKTCPEIEIAALIGIIPTDLAEIAVRLEASALNPCIDFISQELVNDAHAKGLKVFVWTVNHPEDIDRMKALNVDGIFTNFPDRVIS